MLPGFEQFAPLVEDCVLSPGWAARAIVERFRPSGKVLDPCEGEGAFSSLIPGCLTCEIRKGTNFYDFIDKVDWIISNPPFSEFARFHRHAMTLADDIVWLTATNKIWNSHAILADTYDWGGIREIYLMGTGSQMGFPVGFSVAATHFQRNWSGPITVSHCVL